MNDLLFKALEAAPTSMGAFDYLKDPLERNNMKALLRMYELIPVLAATILDQMVDRLQDGVKNLYSGTIKKDYPRIISMLQEASRQTMQRYKDDEKEGYATIVGEYHLQMKMLDDLSRKVLPYISKDTRNIWKGKPEFYDLMSKGRIKAYVKRYVSLLSLIEDITNTEDIISFKKDVIDRCIPIGQLEAGAEFMFPTPEHAMDDGGQMFTYLGLAEEEIPDKPGNKNIVAHYRKLNDSIHITYIEQNPFRAVIPF